MLKKILFSMMALFGISTGAFADILTEAQKSEITTTLSGAYSEAIGVIILVAGVSAAFYIIRALVTKLAKGRV